MTQPGIEPASSVGQFADFPLEADAHQVLSGLIAYAIYLRWEDKKSLEDEHENR
jgi:hypothetical protein